MAKLYVDGILKATNTYQGNIDISPTNLVFGGRAWAKIMPLLTPSLSIKIRGLSFEEPSFFDTVRTIPRKLGIEHTAAHTHPRPPGEFYPR